MLNNVDLSFPMEELEYFLLILTRVSMFIFAAPIFSRAEIAQQVKACFAIVMSFLLYEAITPHIYMQYTTLLQYTAFVLQEAITGLLIAMVANWCMDIAAFAGQIVDTNVGLSMASQMDPSTQQNVTVSGQFYQYAFMLIFLTSGLDRYLIQVLAESYTLIPMGRAVFNLEAIYRTFLSLLSDYVTLGFRIGLPVFCVALLTNGLLGIMAKVSPQMNMFAIGVQLKVMMGLSILVLTVRLLPDAAELLYTQIRTMVVSMLEALGASV